MTVDVCLLSLVLKILGTTYTFYYIAGSLLLGKVDSQTKIRFHLYAWFVSIEFSNGANAFLSRWHVRFMHLISHHTYNQPVKERQHSSYNGIMTHRKRIKASYQYSCLHIS